MPSGKFAPRRECLFIRFRRAVPITTSTQWEVSVTDGRYILKANGLETFPLEGKVWARDLGTDHYRWQIKSVPAVVKGNSVTAYVFVLSHNLYHEPLCNTSTIFSILVENDARGWMLATSDPYIQVRAESIVIACMEVSVSWTLRACAGLHVRLPR